MDFTNFFFMIAIRAPIAKQNHHREAEEVGFCQASAKGYFRFTTVGKPDTFGRSWHARCRLPRVGDEKGTRCDSATLGRRCERGRGCIMPLLPGELPRRWEGAPERDPRVRRPAWMPRTLRVRLESSPFWCGLFFFARPADRQNKENR